MLLLTKINPFVLLLYFISQILCTMIFFNPVIIAISLITSLLLNVMSSGTKGILFYILFYIIIVISNPVFAQEGENILFYLNNIKVTYESIIYGIIMGGMVLAVFYNIKNFNTYVTQDKFVYIFGKYTPKLALLMSMVINFVPTIIDNANNIYNCQKLIISDNKNLKYRFKILSVVISSLVNQILENGIITAESMSARGYTSSRKNSIVYKIKKMDVIIIIIIILLFILTIMVGVLGYLNFNCYPIVTKLPTSKISIIGYLSFLLLSIMPIIIYLIGEIKWKYSISRI